MNLSKLDILEKFTKKELNREEAIKLLKEGNKFKCATDIINDLQLNKFSLTEGQKALWLIESISAGLYAYNLPGALWIDREVNIPALKNAINKCWERHSSLRTVFTNIDGIVSQKVTNKQFPGFNQVNLTTDEENKVLEVLKTEARKPFDLENGPLMRVTLFTPVIGNYILLMNFHHIIFDGISSMIFMNELLEQYSALVENRCPKLLPLESTYAQFVRQQQAFLNGGRSKEARKYWISQMEGYDPPLELGICKSCTLKTASFNSSRYTMVLDADLAQKLEAFSLESGISLFVVMLCAYNLLLSIYSNREDIIVGVPFAGRSLSKFENIIGNFINLLPFRSNFSQDITFRELLHNTQSNFLEALQYGEYPYYSMVQEWRKNSGIIDKEPVNISFYFQNWLKGSDVENNSLVRGVIEGIGQDGEFDLTLEVLCKNNLTLNFKFNPEIFKAEDIKQLSLHYCNTLRDIIEHQDKKIFEAALLTEDDKKTTLANYNNTKRNYRGNAKVCDLFEEQVQKSPDSIAVVFEKRCMTYEELNHKADMLAECLKESGVTAGCPVGVFMGRTADLLVAIIGIFKAGGVYVPLDPGYPKHRIDYIIKDSGISILLSQSSLKERRPLLSVPVILIDGKMECTPKPLVENTNKCLQDNDELAYIIHTSGSSGNPKGVTVRHQGLTNFLLSMSEEPGFTNKDYLLALTTICFDISLLELLLPLVTGGTVEILSESIIHDGILLKEAIEASDATVVQATPATWKILQIAGWTNSKSIKILCGGEALSRELADFLLNDGEREVWNLYGPTETTIWSTAYRLTPGEKILIGRPIRNTECYILNSHMKPVPAGVTGDLYIGGDGVAKGYLNQPELTRERFIQHPFRPNGERLYMTGDLARYTSEGLIEFLGRSDQQVKLNGFRIELEEIETALQKIEGITVAIASVRKDGNGNPSLIAFIIPDRYVKLEAAFLKEKLGDWLPSYMVPSRFIQLELFPMTLNKKIDRKTLDHTEISEIVTKFGGNNIPASERETLVEDGADSTLQEALCGVVAQVGCLNIEEIKATVHFGDYGFDSVKFVELSMAINKLYGIKIYPTAFYQYPDLKSLTIYIERKFKKELDLFYKENSSIDNVNSIIDKVDVKGIADLEVEGDKIPKDQPVAIVGASAVLPGSPDLEMFWDNLINGRDLVTEAPKGRWSAEGVSNSPDFPRRGGYVDEIDKFDPGFFGISPREAELMDPQQRIFLEMAWKAIEDSGHKPSELSGTRTGVYVGITGTDYEEKLGHSIENIEAYSLTGMARTIIANRVSFLLNLKGPSSAIDTACSSSLVSVHRAVRAIQQGDCDMALAGGANLIISAVANIAFSKNGMTSKDGRCKTFDKSADGYVRGEGVAAVFLKRLSKAIEDKDHIYGVVLGSAENHGGRANSLTAPNPNAQAELIEEAYERAGIDPGTVTFIETHGTGTPLGDPVEINGLKSGFEKFFIKHGGSMSDKPVCGLGSVKTNLGHLEAAAGVTGLIKVLMSLKYKKIPPNLHLKEINPQIELENTPFYIVSEARDWEHPADARGKKLPLRAGVSSFGMGGSNAHLVLEEYINPAQENRDKPLVSNIFVLSAQNGVQLEEYIDLFIKFLENKSHLWNKYRLESLAYTLQVGREDMKERLAIVYESLPQLFEKITAYSNKKHLMEGVFAGNSKAASNTGVDVSDIKEGTNFIKNLIRNRDIEKLAQLWVSGSYIEWDALYEGSKPCRISIPSYPFAKESYWVDRSLRIEQGTSSHGKIAALSALIDSDESTPEEQCFKKRFYRNEVFLRHHIVGGKMILPGVVYLEMIRMAGELASEKFTIGQIKNIVWVQPVVVEEDFKDIFIKIHPQDKDMEFQVLSINENNQNVIHSYGCLGYGIMEKRHIDLKELKEKFTQVIQGDEFYKIFPSAGFDYGLTFKAIREVYYNGEKAFSHISIDESIKAATAGFLLHPSIMEGALQTAVGLLADGNEEKNEPYLPFSMGEVCIYNPMDNEMFAYVVQTGKTASGHGKSRTFDILVINADGSVATAIKDYVLHTINKEESENPLYYKVDWSPNPLDKAVNSRGIHGTTLLFDNNESIGKEEYGIDSTLIRIYADSEYKKTGKDKYCIDPSNGKHYMQLFSEIESEGLLNIIHNWSEGKFNTSGKIENQTYIRSVQSVFNIAKALAEGSVEGKVKLIYTYCSGEKAGNPLFDAVSGLLKAIAAENPKCLVKSIEFRDMVNREAIADEIVNMGDWASEVLYAGGKRYTRLLNKVDLSGQANGKAMFREKGVYLITGGTGALGFQLGRFLAENFKARLVLNSRSALADKHKDMISSLEQLGAEVLFLQGDIAHPETANKLIEKIKVRFNTVNGIIHCAGIVRDSLLSHKNTEEFEEVLGPKVWGTAYLDEASSQEPLDFFMMFSSLSAVFGNIGQSDYSYANSFLDKFVLYREALREEKLRHGKTVSINWPFWEEGGIKIDDAYKNMYKDHMGIRALATASGIDAAVKILESPFNQLIVLEGDHSKIRNFFKKDTGIASGKTLHEVILPADNEMDAGEMKDHVLRDLIRISSDILKIKAEKIDSMEEMTQYGYDSLSFMDLSKAINKTFNMEITPSVFFEYTKLDTLADYLCIQGKDLLHNKYLQRSGARKSGTAVSIPKFNSEPVIKKYTSSRIVNIPEHEPIAVIGMSGVMPQSESLEEFWDHLLCGRNLVTEVPTERWDWREYYGNPLTQGNKTNSKWGAFIRGVDRFDASFFGISPKEAKMMDPQQRIFLEVLWNTMEDAGYKVSDLSQKSVGVFVGVSNSDYSDLLKEAGEEIDVHGMIGNGHPYLANRISFLLNLKGPSEPINTLCSSSLVSIHRAIESIRNGSSDLAIAGGINIILKPTLNIFFSKAGMLSPEGMCKTFDKDANGFVRGEGAGAILLKPLSKAEKDGDRIYAVIKGSAVNHGGRSSTITSPNTAAQTDVIIKAMEEAQIDPQTIGYVEAHGTGTALGDPVEVTALTKAFETVMQNRKSEFTNKNFCVLGSVKTNIGHLESAAGIAGFIKVLLAMKNGIIPANLHFNQLNQFIKIQDSPFCIADKVRKWELLRDGSGNLLPRRAGISSFGAGGVNAHIVLEEYQQPIHVRSGNEPCIVILSAKTSERIDEYVQKMLAYLSRNEAVRLIDIAYTLQMGREPMRYRLAMIASDIDELKEMMEQFVSNPRRENIFNLFYGDSMGSNGAYAQFIKGDEGREYIDNMLLNKRYSNIASMWVSGVEFNWRLLYKNELPMKISLPVYPFKREHYWVNPSRSKTAQIAALHPLLDKVLPAMPSKGVIFEKKLTLSDMVISQHQVRDEMVLPGVAHLEMAYAAVKLLEEHTNYKLAQVVWQSPVELDGGEKPVQLVVKEINGKLGFEASGYDGNNTIVFSKGFYIPVEEDGTQKNKKVDIRAIIDRCDICIDADTIYQGFRNIGINHGKFYQGVKEIRCNKNEALGMLELPSELVDSFGQYLLHPSIMDSALQGMLSFIRSEGVEKKTMLPFMVEEVEYIKPITCRCYSYLRPDGRNRYNIAILDEDGILCVRISGVVLREIQKLQENMYFTPQWVRQDVPPTSDLKDSNVEGVVIIYPPETESIKKALEELHSDDVVYGIKLGACELQESMNNIEIDSGCHEEIERFINRISRIDRVYFLGGLAGQCKDNELNQKVFENSQEAGIYSLFRLIKTLSLHKGLSKDFKFKAAVTGVYPEREGNISSAFSAGIDGFLRVVSREYPNWQVTCIDINTHEQNTEQNFGEWLSHFYNEPAHKNSEAVSIRRGARYVRTLEPAIIPAAKETPIRNGGVYVILGGTGGIGLKLAGYLTEKAKAKLVLIGRKELDADMKKRIEGLTSNGGEVLYIRADANDQDSLKAAFERIHLAYGSINGAFHSALELQDTSIDAMNENVFREGYNIKSAGCFNFWHILKNEPLDFLAFFSSVQSIFGGVGQANYVAGCTFEDALSLALNYKSSYPVKLINWGRWGIVGAVSGDEYDLRFKSQGIHSILPDEGIDAIMRILSQPCSQVIVFKAESELIKKMGINGDYIHMFLPEQNLSLIKAISTEVDYKIGALDYENLKEPFSNLGWLCRMLLFSKLQKYFSSGVTQEDLEIKIGVIPEYERLFAELICILQKSGLVYSKGDCLCIASETTPGKLSQEIITRRKMSPTLDAWPSSKQSLRPASLKRSSGKKIFLQSKKFLLNRCVIRLPEIMDEIIRKYPSVKPHISLLSKGLESLEEILSGRIAATDVLFPEGSNNLVEAVYQGNPVADYFNRIVAAKALSYVRMRLNEKPDKISILEIGAGTGSTSRFVLQALVPYSHSISYSYTDISSGFVQYGKNTFAAEYPFVKFRTLDIDKSMQLQDMSIGGYDIVIAANVLHATRDVKATLSNIKAVLKTNGLLILNEVTENDEFSTLTFGLLKGWWLYKDSENRLPGGPLLGMDLWKRLLQEEGFAPVFVQEQAVNQHVILAESNGAIRIVENIQGNTGIIKQPKGNSNQKDLQITPVNEKKAPAEIPENIARKSGTEEDIITEMVAMALEMVPQAVDRKRQFFEYGIDSINGVELVNKLSDIFKVELSKTVIFDYPSVNEMAVYIRNLLQVKNTRS